MCPFDLRPCVAELSSILIWTEQTLPPLGTFINHRYPLSIIAPIFVPMPTALDLERILTCVELTASGRNVSYHFLLDVQTYNKTNYCLSYKFSTSKVWGSVFCGDHLLLVKSVRACPLLPLLLLPCHHHHHWHTHHHHRYPLSPPHIIISIANITLSYIS